MAHVFSARGARNASSASLNQASPVPELEQLALESLRRLKTTLQQRFPYVKSSHLSEAIASGFGYSTNAALRADLSTNGFRVAYEPLVVQRLRDRLVDLQYPLREDLSLAPPASPQPPPHYLERLAELRRLQENPEHVYGRIERLRALCAADFAKAFGLGHPQNLEDKGVAQRWNVGVDHGACLPGWGGLANSRTGGGVDFPGSDHRVHFYEDLPLANKSKHCEYQVGFVSMPYSGPWSAEKLKEAAVFAGRLGWTMSFHNEWAWYQAGQTDLVLFRRTTPHEKVLQDWEHSFSRWAVENRSRLAKSGSDDRRKVLEDITSCQHLPLDVRDFEDCRERYLKEFAVHLYHDTDSGLGLAFRQLMLKWQESRGQ